MKQSLARLGCSFALFAASCAQSTAIDAWDVPGQGLGGTADDGETVEPRTDAGPRDARVEDRADARAPIDEPGEPIAVDAGAPDAHVEPSVGDAGAPPPVDPPDSGSPPSEPPQDAGSAPADAGSAPVDAGSAACAACPPPGESCQTPFGTCGCRLLPIGPCGPRPPFAP